jgi:hypothetical protein
MSSVSIDETMKSVAARIRIGANEARARLDDVSRSLQAAADKAADLELASRPIEDPESVLRRVRSALVANDLGELPRRDVRVALQYFTRFDCPDIARLLTARPTLWAAWVRHFMASRVDLFLKNEESRWLSVVRQCPERMLLLDGTALSREALLVSGALVSASQVVSKVPSAHPLRAVFEWLTAPGLLGPRWRYTAASLGSVVAQEGRSTKETWAAIRDDAALGSIFLPRDRRPRPKGGRDERLVVDESIEARAQLAIVLMRDELDGGEATRDLEWRHFFFESETFRDPRQTPDARRGALPVGWAFVRRVQPDLYSRYIDKLLAEDIEVFFSNVDMDINRKRFWTKYVSSATSSRFFLCYSTRRKIQAEFGGSDEKIRAVLGRAASLGNEDVDAFSLGFGEYAVVEFSRTGNAAYIYKASHLDLLVASGVMRARDLKNKDLGDSLRHVEGWERNFRQKLSEYGVVPAVRL